MDEQENDRPEEYSIFTSPQLGSTSSALSADLEATRNMILQSVGIVDNQRAFGSLVRRYYFQLTAGCSNPNCTNEFCASNPLSSPISQRDASELSVSLAKLGTINLCPDILQENLKFQKQHVLTIEPDEKAPSLSLSTLQTMFNDAKANDDYRTVTDALFLVFSKPESLCQSFMKLNPTAGSCPTDMNQVREAYQIIMQGPDYLIKAVTTGIEHVISAFIGIGESIVSIKPKYLSCLLIAIEFPLLIEMDSHASLVPKLCDTFSTLGNIRSRSDNPLTGFAKSEEVYDTLIAWFRAEFSNPLHLQRCVSIFQQFITLRLLTCYPINPNKDDLTIKGTKTLGFFYQVNQTGDEIIPYTEFYNDTINEQMEIKEDFPHWKAKEGFSFCNYPYVLTATTKTDVLKVESMVQMRHELQDAFFRAMFAGVQNPYLTLEIRREFIIRDALFQLESKTPEDLKKQLRIQFVGEEGVDEGGVQKEFFQLVIREMFDEKYGMFSINEDTNLCWFSSNALEDPIALDEYKLIGRLIGLAIYNSVILDVHFPIALYKKLSGINPSLADLKQYDPALGNGLDQLLKIEGDVKEYYERTFQIEYNVLGTRCTYDLKPNGASIELTNENRQEFVDLYVDFVFNKAQSEQFRVFKEGFDSVCSGSAIQLFRPEELELLVCGSSDLDFEALEKVVVYDSGYTKDTPVIKSFWEVVHGFTEAEKKRLLFFATGTDRVPIGGLSKLNFVIARNGPDSERLPTSHTCFNVLLLSEYSSKEKLKERLLTAIENAEGFGLI